ncbi:rRNA-processing protein FCF2, partial [Camellia lanceoleosa]
SEIRLEVPNRKPDSSSIFSHESLMPRRLCVPIFVLLRCRLVGTVIESASDLFTGRLTKKERKATLADELLSDHTLGEYRKRKVQEIEEQNRPGGVEKWKIKGRQSWKRAKQRRH